ncbi:MAG: hypothetical protein KAS17_08350 [Victivallaceae bacterium]|nr:hypothetical protein [Victivallaceae bacterium]
MPSRKNSDKKSKINFSPLMFTRWIQENDFLYEGRHIGINQITSYDCKHPAITLQPKEKEQIAVFLKNISETISDRLDYHVDFELLGSNNFKK